MSLLGQMYELSLCLGPLVAYIGDWPGSGSDQAIGAY